MTQLNTKQLDSKLKGKRNAAVGTLNQAKGVARENIGKWTNDTHMKLGGKKDQVVGTLQKNIGDGWAYHHKNFLFACTTGAFVAAAVFYFTNRSS